MYVMLCTNIVGAESLFLCSLDITLCKCKGLLSICERWQTELCRDLLTKDDSVNVRMSVDVSCSVCVKLVCLQTDNWENWGQWPRLIIVPGRVHQNICASSIFISYWWSLGYLSSKACIHR